MNDEARLERPARPRLGLDLAQHLLGHAGIMLHGHGADAFAVRHVPHQPDEADEAADVALALRPPGEFRADLDILALHAYGHARLLFDRLMLNRKSVRWGQGVSVRVDLGGR